MSQQPAGEKERQMRGGKWRLIIERHWCNKKDATRMMQREHAMRKAQREVMLHATTIRGKQEGGTKASVTQRWCRQGQGTGKRWEGILGAVEICWLSAVKSSFDYPTLLFFPLMVGVADFEKNLGKGLSHCHTSVHMCSFLKILTKK